MTNESMSCIFMKLSQKRNHSENEWDSIARIISILSCQAMDCFNINEFHNLCYSQ
jgi:hypothetical protein